MAGQEQQEEPDRERDAQGQRLDGARAGAVVAVEEEEAGEQAADDADQHENDDELEHG